MNRAPTEPPDTELMTRTASSKRAGVRSVSWCRPASTRAVHAEAWMPPPVAATSTTGRPVRARVS